MDSTNRSSKKKMRNVYGKCQRKTLCNFHGKLVEMNLCNSHIYRYFTFRKTLVIASLHFHWFEDLKSFILCICTWMETLFGKLGQTRTGQGRLEWGVAEGLWVFFHRLFFFFWVHLESFKSLRVLTRHLSLLPFFFFFSPDLLNWFFVFPSILLSNSESLCAV